MVSGWDKNPPPDAHQPEIGWGGRLLLSAIIVMFGLGSLGWLLVWCQRRPGPPLTERLVTGASRRCKHAWHSGVGQRG